MSEIKMVTDVQIDLYGETQYFLVSAKQGDRATRFLRVQLMNNGNEFEIPDDVMLISNIKKPDKKFCYNECETEDNRVMVELTNQALAAAGTAYCDIEIRTKTGEKILSSAAFTIEIEPSMRNEDAILSSNEMTALDNRVQKYIDKMMAARKQIIDTEEAFKIAEAARALAEADRIAAENIRIGNENKRIEAEQIRQEQFVEMKKATNAANTAAGKANDAAGRAEEIYQSEVALNDTLANVRESFKKMQDMKTEASEANASAQQAATKAEQAAKEAQETLMHTHDDRYYTEAETDILLGGKAAASHTHTKAEVGLGNVDNTADAAKSVHDAKQLTTARNISISDSTGSNTGAAVPFDGSANKTLKLPLNIAANVTGKTVLTNYYSNLNAVTLESGQVAIGYWLESTLNTPYTAELTGSGSGVCITWRSGEWYGQTVFTTGGNGPFTRLRNGSTLQWGAWGLSTSLQSAITKADSAATAASSAQTTANTAKTTANAAMPKTGGTFTGKVAAQQANYSDPCLRNCTVYNSAWNTLQSTQEIVFVRK